MKLRFVLVVLAVLCVCSAQASQLTIYHSMDDSFPQVVDEGGVTNTTGSSLQDSGSLNDENFSAEVSYGSAKISSFSSSGSTDYGLSSVQTAWMDTLTVNASGYSSGFMDLTFSLSGSTVANSSGNGSAGATYEVHIGYDLSPFYSRLGGDAGGDPLTDFTADGKGIVFGTAFDLQVELGAYPLTSAGIDGSGSATITDLELTLTDIKISATEGGDRIAATIISGSGTDYPMAPIPEPASAVLVMFSAAGFFLYRRFLLLT